MILAFTWEVFMVAAALTRLRLIAMLTTVSIIAVGISVALVTTGRSAERSGPASERSADDLTRRAIERRAVEAVIWGMPAVNYHLMYQEMVRKTKGNFNQVLYWSRLLDWKNQTLTPNPDVIYLMPFFNTPIWASSMITIFAGSMIWEFLARTPAGAANTWSCRPATRARCRLVTTLRDPTRTWSCWPRARYPLAVT
jgi:hypothetical protein